MPRRFYLPPTPPSHAPQRGGRKWGKYFPFLAVGLVLALFVLLLSLYMGDDGWFNPAAPAQKPQAVHPDSAVPRELLSSSPTSAGSAVSNGMSADSTAAPLAAPIRIQVLNGCGVKGLTRLVTPAFRARGFDVRESRNAPNFDYTQSLVIDRTGNARLAEIVADSLGIDRARVTTEIGGSVPDIDVSVVVGADYRSLKLDIPTATKE